MRLLAVTYAFAATVLACSAAVAQNDRSSPRSSGDAQTTGQADPATGQARSGREAPVDHRQPKAKDVPPGIDQNLGVRSPEDQAIDRKLRICRDC